MFPWKRPGGADQVLQSSDLAALTKTSLLFLTHFMALSTVASPVQMYVLSPPHHGGMDWENKQGH